MALTIGPLQTAKLLTFLAGLGCTVVIFALGRRLGGDQAGGVAAFVFYSLPMVVELSQTAYLDLFTTLFGVTAALVIVSRERPDGRSAIAAGVCLGLGVAVKVHFGYVAVGLAVTAALLSVRRGGGVAVARSLALLTVVAMLTAAPWLARSYLLTGQVPGVELGARALLRAADERPAAMADLTKFGYGRSPADLARLPLDISLNFPIVHLGEPISWVWHPNGGPSMATPSTCCWGWRRSS